MPIKTLRYSCLVILLPTSTFAQTSQVAQAGTVSPSTGLFQIFLALAAVIAIMLLLAWMVKRVGPIASGHKLPVKVIGGISIGNRERVMVIEVADQWLVLGVTAQQINTLASLPKQDLSAIDTGTTPIAAPFADWLKKTLEKRNPPQH